MSLIETARDLEMIVRYADWPMYEIL